MAYLEKLFIKLHNLLSRKDEETKLSGGFFPPRIRIAVKNLCMGKKGNLLDVGCGEGLFLESLAKDSSALNIIGIDNWKEILDETAKRIKKANFKNVKLMFADIKSLPFKNYYFDTVVCINTLYNLISKKEVALLLKEMIRVCKKEGSLIFDIRNKLNPLIFFGYKLKRYYDNTSDWPVNAYYIKEISEILEREGFCIKRKICLGLSLSMLAPAIIIEAKAIESKERKR